MHYFTHPSDSVNPIRLVTAAVVKDGELRNFDAEETFLETNVGEEIYIQDSREISEVPGGMRLLNKIHGLVQAGRCLFNIFCDDKLEQSEADRRVFRNSRWRGGDGGVYARGRHPCSCPSDGREVHL